jgi:hypothetical protein
MENIFVYLISPELQHRILIIKILFYLVSFFLFASIVYFVRKGSYLQTRFRKRLITKDYHDFKSKHSRRHSKEWAKITKLLESESESEDKLAIIEVGSLTEKILKELGFQGETLEESLKKAFPQEDLDFSEIQRINEIRQRIIKNPKEKFNHQQAKEGVEVFSKILGKLNYF